MSFLGSLGMMWRVVNVHFFEKGYMIVLNSELEGRFLNGVLVGTCG